MNCNMLWKNFLCVMREAVDIPELTLGRNEDKIHRESDLMELSPPPELFLPIINGRVWKWKGNIHSWRVLCSQDLPQKLQFVSGTKATPVPSLNSPFCNRQHDP